MKLSYIVLADLKLMAILLSQLPECLLYKSEPTYPAWLRAVMRVSGDDGGSGG